MNPKRKQPDTSRTNKRREARQRADQLLREALLRKMRAHVAARTGDDFALTTGEVAMLLDALGGGTRRGPREWARHDHVCMAIDYLHTLKREQALNSDAPATSATRDVAKRWDVSDATVTKYAGLHELEAREFLAQYSGDPAPVVLYMAIEDSIAGNGRVSDAET